LKTRFIVVRHCEAYGNIKRVFNGVSDGDITENGRTQLGFLSERMKGEHFDAIYSSPLRRSVKTAKACNIEAKLPIHILNDLIEINGGKIENVPFANLPKMFPEEMRWWNLEPHNFKIENGESMLHVYERMRNTVLMLNERHFGQSVLLASHGCAIRNLLCWAHGWPIERLNDIDWGENTCVSAIDVDENGIPELIYENDASHIPHDYSTLGKQVWWKKENRDRMYFE